MFVCPRLFTHAPPIVLLEQEAQLHDSRPDRTAVYGIILIIASKINLRTKYR